MKKISQHPREMAAIAFIITVLMAVLKWIGFVNYDWICILVPLLSFVSLAVVVMVYLLIEITNNED